MAKPYIIVLLNIQIISIPMEVVNNPPTQEEKDISLYPPEDGGTALTPYSLCSS